MPELLTPTFLTAVLVAGLFAAVPLVFAGVGEMVAEQAGMLNVGLEGMMLTGAFVGFVAALATGDPWVGFLAGVTGGALVSLVVVVCCIRLGLDQVVVGIAIVLGAQGVTAVLHEAWYARSYPRLPAVPGFRIPILADIPVLGGSVFSQPLVVYLGVALVAVTAWGLRRTRFGLEVRAAGERPDALDVAGVSVVRVRTVVELACGGLAGLGGAYLAIAAAGTFVPFVTEGRGFIAIVIAMLARGRAWWALGAALLFGLMLSMTTALQLAGIQVPVDLVELLPFVSVMVVLVLFARDARLPSALGSPYVRGAR